MFIFIPFIQASHFSRFDIGTNEEYYLEYTAAQNFSRFGFRSNLGIPDYATSPRAEDHPYLYTHMPAGPSLLNGLLLSWGGKPIHLRYVAAFFSALGLFFFGLFIANLTQSTLLGAIAILLLITANSAFMVSSDHFVHCYYLLSYFGGLWAADRYLQKHKPIYLYGLGAFVGLASLTSFFATVPLILTIVVIILGNRSPLRAHLLKPLLVFPLYIALHVFRNVLVLGTSVGLGELFFTLQNRISGVPSRSSLKQYFIENNLVLWGAEKTPPDVFSHLFSIFDLYWLGILFFILTHFLLRFIKRQDKLCEWKRTACFLIAIFVGLVLSWNFLFPAHSRRYFIHALLSLPAVVTICLLAPFTIFIFQHIDFSLSGEKKKRGVAVLFFVWIMASLVAILSLSKDFYEEIKKFKYNVAVLYGKEKFSDDLLAELKLPTNEPIWTDMFSTVIYSSDLDSGNPIYGPCTLKALIKKEASSCPVIFIHDWQKKDPEELLPKYYVLSKSRSLQTGWSRCRRETKCYSYLYQYLESHFAKVKESSFFTVYDVNYLK